MKEIFFEIHKDLSREGPGNSESTRRAFSMLTDLPAEPDILDIGCGPGMQTLDLTRLTDGIITALDNHQPYLDAVKEKMSRQNLGKRIMLVNGDMNHPCFPEKTFDLIWSEGALYIMGFEKGLRKWRPFLKQNGYFAVSEISWLKPNPPKSIEKFWDEYYPAIQDIEANLSIIHQTGYKPRGHFTLPESAWWDHYYLPIEEKLSILRKKYKGNAEAIHVLELEQEEIDMYKKFSDYYGYVFYVMLTV